MGSVRLRPQRGSFCRRRCRYRRVSPLSRLHGSSAAIVVLRAIPHKIPMYARLDAVTVTVVASVAARAACTANIADLGGYGECKEAGRGKLGQFRHGLHRYSTRSSRYISTSSRYAVNTQNGRRLLRRRKRSPRSVMCCNQRSRTSEYHLSTRRIDESVSSCCFWTDLN
jgi:hypothetical protein